MRLTPCGIVAGHDRIGVAARGDRAAKRIMGHRALTIKRKLLNRAQGHATTRHDHMALSPSAVIAASVPCSHGVNYTISVLRPTVQKRELRLKRTGDYGIILVFSVGELCLVQIICGHSIAELTENNIVRGTDLERQATSWGPTFLSTPRTQTM